MSAMGCAAETTTETTTNDNREQLVKERASTQAAEEHTGTQQSALVAGCNWSAV